MLMTLLAGSILLVSRTLSYGYIEAIESQMY